MSCARHYALSTWQIIYSRVYHVQAVDNEEIDKDYYQAAYFLEDSEVSMGKRVVNTRGRK